MKKEKILFLCAHNDDQVIGAGGTIAKYVKEGKGVYTVIFSHGEKSHPWIKPEHIIKERIKEANACNNVLGGEDIIFLDLKEGHYLKDYEETDLKKRLVKIIRDIRPSKIFCHGIDDPHPDHQAVYKITNDLIETIKFKGDVYMYDVWTPLNFRKTNQPKMVVDITKTFKTKIKAFRTHKSQKMTILSLLWSIYVRALMNGINNNCKYAEVFHKLK